VFTLALTLINISAISPYPFSIARWMGRNIVLQQQERVRAKRECRCSPSHARGAAHAGWENHPHLVGNVNFGTQPHQSFHSRGIAKGDSIMEGRPTVLQSQEQSDRAESAVSQKPESSCSAHAGKANYPYLVGGVDIGTYFDERLCNLTVALVDSLVEGRKTVLQKQERATE
jgi:hypothetical protein